MQSLLSGYEFIKYFFVCISLSFIVIEFAIPDFCLVREYTYDCMRIYFSIIIFEYLQILMSEY